MFIASRKCVDDSDDTILFCIEFSVRIGLVFRIAAIRGNRAKRHLSDGKIRVPKSVFMCRGSNEYVISRLKVIINKM